MAGRWLDDGARVALAAADGQLVCDAAASGGASGRVRARRCDERIALDELVPILESVLEYLTLLELLTVFLAIVERFAVL